MKGVERNTKQIEELRRLSNASFSSGDYVGARQHLETAVSLGCDDASVLTSLGYVCHLSGDNTSALKYCEHAKSFAPLLVDNYGNMALALFGLKRHHQALIVIEEGLSIDPEHDDLWVNHGLALMAMNRPIEAQSSYAKAIRLNPNNVSAMTNQAIALQENGLAEQAHDLYQRVSHINSQFTPALSNSLMCAQYHPSLASQEIVAQTRRVAEAYIALAQKRKNSHSPESITHSIPIDCNAKLKVGLYGPDLRAHPVGWFIRKVIPILAQQFDLHVFFSHATKDAVSAEIEESVQAWHNCIGWSDQRLIEQSQDDGVDIAVDLTGHTAHGRISAFAKRLAPVQVSWLGFPASTGLPTIDAVLLSEDLVTNATQAYFTEPVIAFDAPQFIYQPPDYIPGVVAPPCISNGYITFGCFNNLAKLNDSVVSTWALLLKQLPHARLILKWKSLADGAIRESVLKRFHAAGVAQTRIELRGASEHTQMFREYGDIDIALDPFPFSGALTSFEAAWMGLPVVTLASYRPMSRQTLSLNKALGFADLIASTPQEYVAAALGVAQDISRLKRLRETMRERIESSSLCDADHMAKAIATQLLKLAKNIK